MFCDTRYHATTYLRDRVWLHHPGSYLLLGVVLFKITLSILIKCQLQKDFAFQIRFAWREVFYYGLILKLNLVSSIFMRTYKEQNKLKLLRIALIKGEKSGHSTSFDFEGFILIKKLNTRNSKA